MDVGIDAVRDAFARHAAAHGEHHRHHDHAARAHFDAASATDQAMHDAAAAGGTTTGGDSEHRTG